MTATKTAPTKTTTVSLPLTRQEAMSLWDLLDRITAGQTIDPAETLPKGNHEPLRWVRERLAQTMYQTGPEVD